MEKLNIGDTVIWRGCFGTAAPLQAKVTGISITSDDDPKGEDAEPQTSVAWSSVKDRDVVVDLDNHTWAYGGQISPFQASSDFVCPDGCGPCEHGEVSCLCLEDHP
jgi:hypothetical protein